MTEVPHTLVWGSKTQWVKNGKKCNKKKCVCTCGCTVCFKGWIHLPHLQIHKYFMDDSFINFHEKFFLHFLPNFSKRWRKTLPWKIMDETSVKYLQVHKWDRWICPKAKINVFLIVSPHSTGSFRTLILAFEAKYEVRWWLP